MRKSANLPCHKAGLMAYSLVIYLLCIWVHTLQAMSLQRTSPPLLFDRVRTSQRARPPPQLWQISVLARAVTQMTPIAPLPLRATLLRRLACLPPVLR